MSGPDTQALRGGNADPAPSDPRLHPDRLRFALDVGHAGIWSWHEEAQDFFGDRGASLLWGLSAGDVMSTEAFKAAIAPEDAERTFDELRRASSPQGPEQCQVEFRILRPSDGVERWIALQGRRYRDKASDQGSFELIGMARDVTSRKQRELHTHLLMREVTHRSKNLLAIIQAMARQTVKDSLSAVEFEQRFSTRLRGLAASHELLAARDWHGAAIGELVRWQIGPAIEAAGNRISIAGPDLYLNPEAAQNIGLALNELASNASRFGALSVPEGRVDIVWSLDESEGDGRRFRIGWRESGGPEVSAPRRTGFGHKVMERLTARALDGRVDLSFLPSGLRWSLEIPASFVLDAADVPIVN